MTQTIRRHDIGDAVEYFEGIAGETKVRWALECMGVEDIIMRLDSHISKKIPTRELQTVRSQIWSRDFMEYVSGSLGLL